MKCITHILLASYSLFAVPEFGVMAEDTNGIPKITIQELLQNKEKWKGKRVEVCGFYISRFEVSALYASELEAGSPHDTNSLWIDYYDEIPKVKGKLNWVNRGYVRIIGTFEFRPDSGSGHLNQWPARIKGIELVQLIQEPRSKATKPAKDKKTRGKCGNQ